MPNLLRCERKRRRYNGIGGSKVTGIGLKDVDAPASEALASNRETARMFNGLLRWWSRQEPGMNS